MKRTFTRLDVLLAAGAGALLMLGAVMLIAGSCATDYFIGAVGLIGLVFWPDVEGGKEGGE